MLNNSKFVFDYFNNKYDYIAQHPLFKEDKFVSMSEMNVSFKDFNEYEIPSIYNTDEVRTSIQDMLTTKYADPSTTIEEIQYAIYTAIDPSEYDITTQFEYTLPDGSRSSTNFIGLIVNHVQYYTTYLDSSISAKNKLDNNKFNTFYIEKQNDWNTDWLSSIKMSSGIQHSAIPFVSYWKMNYSPASKADFRVLSDWKGGLSYTIDDMKLVNKQNYNYVKEVKEQISFAHPKYCAALFCTIYQCTKLTSGQLNSFRTFMSPQDAYSYFPGHTASGASPIPGEYTRKKGDPYLMFKTINRLNKFQDYISNVEDWSISDPITSALQAFSDLSETYSTMDVSPWNYPTKVNKRNQYRGKLVHPHSFTQEEWDDMKHRNSDVIRRDYGNTTIFKHMSDGTERSQPKASDGFEYPSLERNGSHRYLKSTRYISTLAIKIRDMYPVAVYPSLIQFCWIRDLIENEIERNNYYVINSPRNIISATGLDISQMGVAIDRKFFSNSVKNLDLKSTSDKENYELGSLHGTPLSFEIDGKAWDQHFTASLWIGFFSDLRMSMNHNDHLNESQIRLFDAMVTLTLFSQIKFNEDVPIEVLPCFNPSGVPATKTVNDVSNACLANYALHKITKGQCTSWRTGTVLSNGDNLISMFAIELPNKKNMILVEPAEFAYWYSLFNQEIEFNARDLNFQYHKRFPIKFSGYWYKKLSRRYLDYSSLGLNVEIPQPHGIVVPFQPMPQLVDKYYTSEERVTETKFARTRGTFEMSKAVAYSALLSNGLKLLCRGALYDDKIFSEAVYGRYRYGFDVKIPVLDSTRRIVTSVIPIDDYISGTVKDKSRMGEKVQTMILGFGRESNSSNTWVTGFRQGRFSKYPSFEKNHYTMLGRRIIDVMPRDKTVTEYSDPFKNPDPQIYQMKDFRLLCLSATYSVQQIYNVYKLILNYIVKEESIEEQFEDDEYLPITEEKKRKERMRKIDSEKELTNTINEYREFINNRRTIKMQDSAIEKARAINSLLYTMYNISKE